MNQFDYFNWILLPILIFISRLADVTLATLRHIFVSKGFKRIVPFLGFIEILIWLFAMRQVFTNLNNIACFIGWAGGFAMGTYCGMLIEERLALGMQMIRIVTQKNCTELIDALRSSHQGVTLVDAEGAMGPVKIVFTVVKRIDKEKIIQIIDKYHPDAFYSIEDVRSSSHGVYSREGELGFYRRLFPEKSK